MTAAIDAVHDDGQMRPIPSTPTKQQAQGYRLAHYWRSRSPRARRIIALAAVFVAALVAAAIAVGVVVGRRHSHSSSSGTSSSSSVTSSSSSGTTSSLSLTIDLGYASYTGTHLDVQPPGVGNNRSTATNETVAINSYLGMRYAAPPLGTLRWRAPAAPPSSTGSSQPLSAKSFGPICLSTDATPSSSQSEDCLFVNVWAPANSSSPKPVWVFVQGGGYTANADANFNSTDLVARSGGELVFVSFNYRVGLYGFLPGSQVEADGDLNVGLLDQRFLLQWVRTHIAQFGGDPDHVVIHGGSAGAGSVVLQSLAYGGRNDSLFSGLVAESVFLPTQPTCSSLEYKFATAVNSTSCADSSGSTLQLDCMRALSATELQKANMASPLPNATSTPNSYWGPCVDGDFLQDRPYTMFQDGRFVRVPMMVGTTTNEGATFVPDAETLADSAAFMINNYPGLATLDSASANNTTIATSMLAEYYPAALTGSVRSLWFDSLSAAYGELTFICGQVLLLSMAMAAMNSTLSAYAYRFNMQDPAHVTNGLGTVHMMDKGAIFGPDNLPGAPASYYGTDAAGNPGLVPLMMDYYISFILTLSPNNIRSANSAAMDAWSSTASNRLVITTGGNQTMERVPADQAARCRSWLALADLTQQ